MRLRRWWTDEEKGLVQLRYEEEGPGSLARELGKSEKSVARMAGLLGLRSRNKSRRQANSLKVRNRNVSVNTDYFQRWSERMAAVLGYIWADGTVTRKQIGFSCHWDDRDILVKIKSELESIHKIGYRPERICRIQGVDYKCGPQAGLQICGVELVEPLFELGLRPGKSKYDLDFPQTPQDFLACFCRGYLDGDGGVTIDRPRAFFLGTPRFLEGLRERVSRTLSISKPKLCKESRCEKIRKVTWADREEVEKLYKWMYAAECEFSLDRKRILFQSHYGR